MNIKVIGDIAILKLNNTNKCTIFNNRHLVTICLHNENWHENSSGYVQAHSKILKESIFLHQLVTGKRFQDHKDRNPLNNLDSNLRRASKTQNNTNTIRVNKSAGFRGIVFNKLKNRFEASIQHKGVRKHLGGFVDKIEAAKVYDKAALEIHGEFAILNFPISKEPSQTLLD